MSHNTARNYPEVAQNRAGAFHDLTWRFPDRTFIDEQRLPEAPAVCSRCHAYLETDHWLFGERRYAELKEHPEVNVTLCPGCLRAEKRLYEGEVTIRHAWGAVSKDDVLHLIHNEEARARITNPTARVALMEDRGDEIYVLTTTRFLAERIGKELHKAYRGALRVDHLPRERFSRVMWER